MRELSFWQISVTNGKMMKMCSKQRTIKDKVKDYMPKWSIL